MASVVPGAGRPVLSFDSPRRAGRRRPLGRHAASLVLAGTESGQAFADTIPLVPDSLDMLDPATSRSRGTLVPDRVSAGQSRPDQSTVANAGGVPFALGSATRLSIGPPVSGESRSGRVRVGSRRRIARRDVRGRAPLGSPLSTPGFAAALFEARGTEDGFARTEALSAGALAVEAPARIAYVAGLHRARHGARGRDAPGRGDDPKRRRLAVPADPAATTLLVTDGVESAVGVASGAPFLLDPAGPWAALPVPVRRLPPGGARGCGYPVGLTVREPEWGMAESVAVASGPGELRVVEPVVALQIRGLDPGAPVQVAAEDGAVAL